MDFRVLGFVGKHRPGDLAARRRAGDTGIHPRSPLSDHTSDFQTGTPAAAPPEGRVNAGAVLVNLSRSQVLSVTLSVAERTIVAYPDLIYSCMLLGR